MPLTSLWIFFPLAISLHNLEEAIWLPGWSKYAGKFHQPVEANEFYFAVICVTVLAYLATFLAVAFPTEGPWKYIFYGFLGTMILNAFLSHFAATVALRRYSPGLLTGLFLLVPINTIILYQAVVASDIQWPALLLSTIAVSVILLSLLPLFFRVGRKLTEQLA